MAGLLRPTDPRPVDTKFVERHASTLRQWLDLLLPSSAIDVNETKFERRFGLREKQSYRAVRILDPSLQKELGLPFNELSLPIKAISEFRITNSTVVIAENDVNVLTLPPIVRGIGVQGLGSSVSRLEQIVWLNANSVLYWGDIDVEGFLILSRLRNLLPHVESVMMDRLTLLEHEESIVDGSDYDMRVVSYRAKKNRAAITGKELRRPHTMMTQKLHEFSVAAALAVDLSLWCQSRSRHAQQSEVVTSPQLITTSFGLGPWVGAKVASPPCLILSSGRRAL